MRVAIISDTHVPSRADRIPEWVVEEVESADHVVHAGDFDSPGAYERVCDLASGLTTVAGNMDPSNVQLPTVATFDAEGVRFVVTHGTVADISTYHDHVGHVVAENADPDLTTVGVSGHTHQRMDRGIDGYRVLNPGSATGAAPAQDVSMMVAEVADGDLTVETLVRE